MLFATTADNESWTPEDFAAPWIAGRCERGDWEEPATTGLLGPSA
jgi:hypothetical protein